MRSLTETRERDVVDLVKGWNETVVGELRDASATPLTGRLATPATPNVIARRWG